ncbi:MAG: hypothetical protein D3924_14245, partial [Candidatus Electrothrix sp. AR4]|nr:hypothetical protein [Candidatus Electrothrix sp. AR4]
MPNINHPHPNDPENQGRRKTIKRIAVGLSTLASYRTLPEKWTQPAVDLIILPAHAKTSGLSICPNLDLAIVKGTQTSSTVLVQVTGCVT